VFASCGKTDTKPEETTPSTDVLTEPVETTLQDIKGDTLLQMIDVSLISIKSSEFKDMYFSDFIQSTNNPSDVGTAMTILLNTQTDDVSLKDIESVAIKSPTGMAVNMNTDVFFLNNEKCCIIFAKTEGVHKASDFAIFIKTKDGGEKLFSIPEKETAEVVNKYLVESGNAKYGDLIKIKDRVYFILQSGSLSSVVYTLDDKKYTKVILGTSLVPLENDFTYKLTDNDFTSVFYDVDNYGDFNVKIDLFVNNEESLKTYKDSYSGLFVELITCDFTLEVDMKLDVEQSTARRDYVMNNTWIKGTFDENFLYKLYRL
jgi:hypothetical protein